MPFSLTPQTFRHVKTEDGRTLRLLDRDNAYLRLSVGGESVQLQGGQVYGTGGHRLTEDQYPGWLADELKKCNPQTLIDIGWLEPKPVPPPDPMAAARHALSLLSDEERLALLETAPLPAASEAPPPTELTAASAAAHEVDPLA